MPSVQMRGFIVRDFPSRAVQQFVAAERGIAPCSTGFVRRGLRRHRPRHLNSDVGLLRYRISWYDSPEVTDDDFHS